MKKKIYILLLLSILHTSCDLDVDYKDKISGKDAINTPQIARDVLNGVYSSYPKEALSFSTLSDDFFPTYLIFKIEFSSLKKLYDWDKEQIEKFSAQLWTDYYNTIASINIILNSEQYINLSVTDNIVEWEIIKGECYALKAMAYLDLLNIYSSKYADNNLGIILKDQIAIEKKERATQKECIAEISSLLENARSLLKSKVRKSFYYLDYQSTLLLSARAALFSENYSDAISYCEELISLVGFVNEEPNLSQYHNMWFEKSSEYSSSEQLFAFDNKIFPLKNFINSITNGDIVAVNPIYDYSIDDVRYNIASLPFEMKSNASEKVTRNLIGKYRTSIQDYTPHPYNALRIAEAYYILGECYSRTGMDTKARETVNKILKKRNARIIDNMTSGKLLLDRIIEEKRKEFVGEGCNYFDCKRLDKPIKRYAIDNFNIISGIISVNDYRRLFPIPQSELKYNNKAQQNPLWPKPLQ